jgi:cell division protein FtsI (penicillin-binding protein 3)
MRSQALENASQRIVWIRFAGLALVLVLSGRAAHLTTAHTRAQTLYEMQIQAEQTLAPARGTIFDRDGRELAISIEAASIYALPHLLKDPSRAAAALAAALEVDVAHVIRRLAAHDRFTYIARWVDSDAAQRVRDLALAGVGIDREPRRSYPAGKMAAPLIGFANIDGHGVRAIEQMENDWLRGQPRRVRIERDARGRALALKSTDPTDVQGGDIALALDGAMQAAAEAALQDAVEKHGALGGVVLTLDPKNGDILALAEAPGFDPNRFRELAYGDTRARSFSDLVEAGSTMKSFLVASALDAGVIHADLEFDTGDGSIRVRGKTIHDHEAYGMLRPADILRVSSNVGAIQIAQIMGREAQYRGLLRFGFGGSTRSGFPMEANGLVRDWSDWQPVDQATIAFGQGISVTVIQLAAALGALANDGERMQPRIVLARRHFGEAWQPTEIRSNGHAVSANVARRTLDMMRTVVSPEGTGRLAALAGVAVAGKTGTSQKLDLKAKRYSQEKYIAWFMGVVPAEDPELVIVVAIDEPSGFLHSGGYVAAPVFARVAAAQLARRGIVTEPAPMKKAIPGLQLASRKEELAPEARQTTPPETEWRDQSGRVTHDEPPWAAVAAPPPRPAVATAAAGHSRSTAAASVPSGMRTLLEAPAFVPDFYGQTMARARRVAATESLGITTLGAIEGRVVSQRPVPGTLLVGHNRTVRLQFAALREER